MTSKKEAINEKYDLKPTKASPLENFLSRFGHRNRSTSPARGEIVAKNNKSATIARCYVSTNDSSNGIKNTTESKSEKILSPAPNLEEAPSSPESKRRTSPFSRLIHRLSMNRKHDYRINDNFRGIEVNKSHEAICSNHLSEASQSCDSSPKIPTRSAISENDLRLTFLNRNLDINDMQAHKAESKVSSSLSEFNLCDRRVPSYLRISCALNGYTRYNKLNSFQKGVNALPMSIVERRTQIFDQAVDTDAQHAVPAGKEARNAKNLIMDSGKPVQQLVQHFSQMHNGEMSHGHNKVDSENESVTEFDPIQEASIPSSEQTLDPAFEHSIPQLASTETVNMGLVHRIVENNEPKSIDRSLNVDQANKINYALAVSTRSNDSSLDGRSYEKLLNQVRLDLSKKLSETAGILEKNESSLPESVADTLRIFVGKTTLLLEGKIMKFEELLTLNFNLSSEDNRNVTIDDLTGYWTLIEIEISDLNRIFSDIYESRKTGWQFPISTSYQNKCGCDVATQKCHKTPEGQRKYNGKEVQEKVATTERRQRALTEAKQRQMYLKKKKELEHTESENGSSLKKII